MPSPAERMQILNRLEKGEINPQEAARLLSAEESSTPVDNSPMGILAQLDRGEITAEEAARRLEAPHPVVVGTSRTKENSNHKEKLRARTITNEKFDPARTWGWWLLPIALGALVTLLSALWMRADIADGRMGFVFFLAWLPMLLGIALIVFGWLVRNSNWVHLQVKSHKTGRNVNVDLNLPVPLTSIAGLVQGFGVRIPGLEQETMDRVKDALEQIRHSGQPVHIQANSDDGEDAVEIYIS